MFPKRFLNSILVVALILLISEVIAAAPCKIQLEYKITPLLTGHLTESGVIQIRLTNNSDEDISNETLFLTFSEAFNTEASEIPLTQLPAGSELTMILPYNRRIFDIIHDGDTLISALLHSRMYDRNIPITTQS